MNGERAGHVQLVCTPTEGPVTSEHRQVRCVHPNTVSCLEGKAVVPNCDRRWEGGGEVSHTPSESGRSRATQLLHSKMVLNRRSSNITTGTDPTRDDWGRGGGGAE